MHYFGGVPAVLEATRETTRRVVRPETPARLRLWVAVVLTTTVALLAVLHLVMSRAEDQVRFIATEAAPQTATAADLYFALSDLDAQVARLVLAGDQDALAGTRVDALATYQERGRQIDAGLRSALATGADGDLVLDLMNSLAVYRQRVWQALTAGPAAAGYYTQATNVMHLDLLPAAQRWGTLSADRLSDAYSAKTATEIAGVTIAAILGIVLLGLLLFLQVWLARRFRRTLNPGLALATLLVVAVVVPVIAVLAAQSSRLQTARNDDLTPFLTLSAARSLSYDAAADTSRYLISDDPAHYRTDFDRKSGQLTAAPLGSEAAARWEAYRRGHQRILSLADAGRETEAVGFLTGIRRGDAAFDFTYFDAAVASAAAERRAAYEEALRSTRRMLTAWPWVPVAGLGLVILLVPVAVRKRLAEYR